MSSHWRKTVVIIAIALLLIASAGIFVRSPHSLQPQVSPTDEMEVGMEEAISAGRIIEVRGMKVEVDRGWDRSLDEARALVETAMDELGDYGYDHEATITVGEEELFFSVTFPEPPYGEPGALVFCADFAAKVFIDKSTRMVVEIECGG